MTTNIDKAKIKAIGALFVPGAFPRQEQEGTERQLMQVYLIALEDIPADFVAMACKRFIAGQVIGASLTFRPTPPELAVEARRLRDKALDHERLRAACLPRPQDVDPPEPTLEQRQAGASRLRALAATIGAAVAATEMPHRKARAAPAAPARPEQDLSDYPRAGATREEIRAWEARQLAEERER